MTSSPTITIAKYRKFNSDTIQFIEFCVKSEISGAQPIGRLLKSKFPEISIHQKSLYNAIQAAKKHLTKKAKFDTSDLMRYLYSKCTEDSRWFVKSRFDRLERRLSGLIWLSPDQQYLWTRYHDVIFLDTTSRTNKYNIVACFFVIIDNCNKSQLVVSALLEDKTKDSFIWTFQMINKYSDPGIAGAIYLEFSSSVHCLCLFHIDLNLKKNLRNKLNSDKFREFRTNFFKYRNTMVEDLFESCWEALKLKYTLASSYIKHQLDPTKTKWAVYNINNQFTAGANSTQRVESLNHKIYSYVGSNSSLLELEQVNMDYNEGMHEDNYELMKVHLVNIVEKVGYKQIVKIWKLVLPCGTKKQYIILTYKVDIIKENLNKVWEQSPISLCIDNIQNQDTINNFRYLKDIRNSDIYTPVLQKFNSTRQKYGCVQGIIQKVLDLAISTNSYDELI
ncbi:10749_t:CDS:2, partial [Dentiscutata erythropus]